MNLPTLKGSIPQLSRSYRKRFPFRIAATSFVYRGDWAENVRLLGPWVDEIELLFFESTPASLPSAGQMAALASLQTSLGVLYNVHLPYDVSLGAADTKIRQQAVAAVGDAMERSGCLHPTTFTLHLPETPEAFERRTRTAWLDRLRASLEALLASGPPPESISVETLMYPFQWIEPLVAEFGLAVCIDSGHLWRQSVDPRSVLQRHRERVTIIHLHAESGGRDHRPLDRLTTARTSAVLDMLAGFAGTVSLEVFSFDALERSLLTLEKAWQGRNPCGSAGP